MNYDAFISYRHAELDMEIAKKVHKGLETFKVPRSVAKKGGKKKIARVFRDQEELPIGSDLNDNISGALSTSEFLIVICSPRTPGSYWVQKEIETFISMHDRDHVLAVLIEGEPNESFPEQLLKDENGNPVEPLAADVRGTTKIQRNKKFKTEILRLAAPILHCTYDDLRQRHKERRMRKAIAIVAAAGALIAGLGIGFGIYNANMAKQIQQSLEETQISQSKSLADTSEALLKEGNVRAAALVAMEALPSGDNDRPYVADAEYALTDALHTYDTGNTLGVDGILSHDVPVSDMEANADGTLLTTVLSDESVCVWNTETNRKLLTIGPSYDKDRYLINIEYANMFGDNLWVVTEDYVVEYSMEGTEIFREDYDGIISEAGASLDRMELAVYADTVSVYDTANAVKTAEYMPADMSFISEISFSANGRYMALGNYDNYVEQINAAVVDLEEEKTVSYLLRGRNINELIPGDDGTLYSLSDNSNFLDSPEVYEAYAEKFAPGAAEAAWEYVYSMDYTLYYDMWSLLKLGADKSGKGLVVIGISDKLVALDEATGEVTAEFGTGNNLLALEVGKTNGIAYIATENGDIQFYNLNTGIFLSGVTMETGLVLRDMIIRNSTIMLRSYGSPDILLYKYHEGAGMTEVAEYEDDNVTYLYPSEDESVYAVRTGYGSAETEYRFYAADDDSLIGTVTTGDDTVCYDGFLDRSRFFVIGNHGNAILYDVTTKEEKTADFGEDLVIASGASVSTNKKYAVLYTTSGMYTLDLENLQYSDALLPDARIVTAAVSDDGDTLYYCDKDGLKGYIISSGRILSDIPAEYTLSMSAEMEDALDYNETAGLLAFSCIDDTARVYDTVNKKTIAEVPFSSRMRIFVQLSSDGKLLFLQGDDYYFRIYDLEKQDFVYNADEQIYQIKFLRESADGTTISFGNSDGMYIMQREDYSLKTYVNGGKLFLQGVDKIYASYYETLYSFPHASLEDLTALAQERYGDEPLTDMEKLKYHIE